jgi:hypothetical protein
MPTNTKQERAAKICRRTLALWAAALGLAAGSVLFLFDPAEHGFYPFCLFHRLTGLHCPGCGGLRALHQLAHGHLALAFHLNPLLILSLPVGLWVLARQFVGQAEKKSALAVFTRPPWPWILLSALFLFGVVRNLSVPPFASLSP